MREEKKCKVIAVANQKGGVGKTVTCVNLGIGLRVQAMGKFRYRELKEYSILFCLLIKTKWTLTRLKWHIV